ncbi:hypothetical protein PUNSTDRAFT_140337 [Punctularia strigosozonata HHB-11173 SS5]|uniref:uncharacterized protein n=1 Tax=Punctularia strigosozonata (strain HHB-11173) TaxID=741275 RepID=UPI000441828D|nr:uncharacterized protein PUNSTDRAFT_140337 [Punctularia strigosozonata HHB-11173 SS5]EIN13906.1 hypothetical protein PUNSTDRAFT_140337 [Punctularia strigosozonata HHB-11173 SS5]
MSARTASTSLAQGISGLMILADQVVDDEVDSSPRSLVVSHGRDKEKDEAKSNRKIADLEISNRSLLAINSSLEAAKHRQAKEIRDLRRKLRESRLALPPRAFRALAARGPNSSVEDDLTVDEDDEDEEEEEELGDDGLVKGKVAGKEDAAYLRVKDMVLDLIAHGKRALESKAEDFMEHRGTKVLSAEEVRSWRKDSEDADMSSSVIDTSIVDADNEEEDDPDASFASFDDVGPRSSTPLGSGAGNDSLVSETEVEHSLMEGMVNYTPPSPPISISPAY